MIKRIINIEYYWKVIAYYDVSYNLFHYIANSLYNIGVDNNSINRIYYNIIYNAKAFTISNTKLHISVVCFNKHNNIFDYLNSIVHEAEHIKQAMLKSYNVGDYDEAPAYTVANIAIILMKEPTLLNYIK